MKVSLVKLIILGPPGTGKGTLAVELAQKLKLKHISTGDLLREEAKKGSSLGREINQVFIKGGLVSEEIVGNLLENNLPEDNFILDGYPRDLNQAKRLEKITEIDYVINLHTPFEIIIERLSSRRVCMDCKAVYGINVPSKREGICDKCGGRLIQRKDDNPETIAERLETYKKETEPLIKYYNNKIINIDGNDIPSKVLNITLKELDDRNIKVRA